MKINIDIQYSMNYWIIILAIIIIILIYILYAYFYKTPAIISKAEMNNQIPAIPSNKISSPSSQSYTYSMWISLNALPTSSGSNYIFYMSGSGSTDVAIILYFTPDRPQLNIDIGEGSLPSSSTTVFTAGPSNNQVITDNFPLQTWVYITVSVSNGNLIDCYINGKLVKSFYLKGTAIKLPSSNSTINYGRLNATLAGFNRVPQTTDPQTVWNNYLNGSGVSSNTSNYGLNLALTQNTVPQNTWIIF